jgi:hypothetical protein
VLIFGYKRVHPGQFPPAKQISNRMIGPEFHCTPHG